MRFLTSSATYRDGVTITPTSGQNSTTGKHAIDYLYETYLDSTTDPLLIIIDLQEGVDIDSLWFHAEGASNYTLAHAPSSGSFANAFSSQTADDYNFKAFTKVNKQRWLLTLNRKSGASSIKVYEILLMETLLNLSNVDDMPSSYTPDVSDPFSGSYRLSDGRLVSYEGFSERGKLEANLTWEYLDEEVRETLEEIWRGPPKKPTFTFYPEPDEYPDKIYQVYWSNDFNFAYTGPLKQAGYSGSIEVMEI